MTLTNRPDSYGSVAKTFHWLVAALILTQWPLGWVAESWPMDSQQALDTKVWLFSVHKTLGIAIFAVALLRILWALTQPRPRLLNAARRLEAGLAETVHWLLYGALVLVPLTGWLEHSATEGFAPHWWPFGQDLPFVPKDANLARFFATAHVVCALMLAGAVVLHVAGALKHHLIDRDAMLARMLPGRRVLPAPPAGARHGALPRMAALALWAVALAGAFALARAEDEAGAARMAAVPSGWEVQEGSLGITIRQMGGEVSGRFADWTAAIEFAEAATEGRHGTVEVTVAIESLTLGGVTQQAVGRDFLDAASHPRAVFAAEILPGGEPGRYEARGTLTLRGVTVPVVLPFALEIEGDLARMEGGVTVNRMDFGIGEAVRDEGSLGFGVAIDVALSARRAAP